MPSTIAPTHPSNFYPGNSIPLKSPYQMSTPDPINWQKRAIYQADRLFNLSNTILEGQNTRTEHFASELEKLIEDQMSLAKENAVEVQSGSFWSTLQTIADFFLSFLFYASFIFVAIGTGQVYAAPHLIGVCLLSICHLFCSKWGGYDMVAEMLADGDPEKKAHLLTILPLVISVLILFTGLTYQSTLLAQLSSTHRITTFLQILSQVLSGMASIMKGKSDYHIYDLRSQNVELEEKMRQIQDRIEMLSEESTTSQEELVEATNAVLAAASSQIKTLEIFTRR